MNQNLELTTIVWCVCATGTKGTRLADEKAQDRASFSRRAWPKAKASRPKSWKRGSRGL
jgi:hypothetical protein